MKYLSILACLLLLVACHKKISNTILDGVNDQNNPKNLEKKPDLIDKNKAPYLVLSFHRTACYGTCPTYIALFYSNGKASYKGKNFVPNKGYFETQVEIDSIANYVQAALDIDYFSFAKKYPNDGAEIVDLPSCITSVTYADSTHTVFNRHDAPEKLILFEQKIDAFIQKQNWMIAEEPKSE